MDQFITKHQSQVTGVLSGFGRIRFRGTMRMLATVNGLFAWLWRQGILLKGFKSFATSLTEQLQGSIEGVAATAGRKIEYLASSALSKEALVQELLRRENIQEGLVCVLSCVESCRSFDIRRDPVKKPLTGDDARRAEILLRGEFAINGFRNRDVRLLLYGDAADPAAIRGQSGKIGRLLRLFRDHRLIDRVNGTHRYQLSAEGRRILPAFRAARQANTTKLQQLAA